MLFFDSQNKQLSTNPVVSGRVVAIDWHQVTDILTVHPDSRRSVLIGKQVNCLNRFLTSIIRLLTSVDNLTK